MSEKVYGICENKCLKEVAEKGNTVLKENIAIVEGTISLTNGSGSKSVNLPSGFSNNNSVVISTAIIDENNDIGYYGCVTGDYFDIQTDMGSSMVAVRVIPRTSTSLNKTYKFKVVLMKV